MRLLELAGAPYQTAKFQTRLFLLAEKLSGDLGSIPLSTGQFDTEGHDVIVLDETHYSWRQLGSQIWHRKAFLVDAGFTDPIT